MHIVSSYCIIIGGHDAYGIAHFDVLCFSRTYTYPVRENAYHQRTVRVGVRGHAITGVQNLTGQNPESHGNKPLRIIRTRTGRISCLETARNEAAIPKPRFNIIGQSSSIHQHGCNFAPSNCLRLLLS